LLVAAGPLFTASAANLALDGDFSSTTNVGTISGTLIAPNGTDVAIGSTGPWVGNYTGILGLLLPPALTISNTGGFGGTGSATISGIASVNVLGILYNSGSFFESTGSTFTTGQLYQLTADVNVSSVLTLNALASSGVGISLLNGSGTTLASSTTAAPAFVNLTLLSGTTYQLTLDYQATAAATGNIGISLFDAPTNLVTATLFGSATFSNISLAAVPEPTPIAFLGIGLLGLVVIGLCRRRHSAVPGLC
jgi:hypothetical protein